MGPVKKPGYRAYPSWLIRKARQEWTRKVGSITQPAPLYHLRSIFNALGVYPSTNQIHDMMVWAYGHPDAEKFALGFGQFCLLASELKRRAIKRMTSVEDAVLSNHVMWNVKHHPFHEVFISGPGSSLLTKSLTYEGISFKQEDLTTTVSEVTMGKNLARMVVFVFHSGWRNTKTMVEALHHAAFSDSKPAMFVIIASKENHKMDDEVPSDQEYLEFKYMMCVLEAVAKSRNVPLFYKINRATIYIKRFLNLKPEIHYKENDFKGEDIYAIMRNVEKAFGFFTRSNLSIRDAQKALKNLTGMHVAPTQLNDIMLAHDDNKAPTFPLSINFEAFHLILAELNVSNKGISLMIQPNKENGCIKSVIQGFFQTYNPSSNPVIRPAIDVYLGGSIIIENDWREKLVMPRLRDLDYNFVTQRMKENKYTLTIFEAETYNIPQHRSMKIDKFYDEFLMWSKVLLFVLDDQSRCNVQMALAAHWMALRPNAVVLCVMKIDDMSFSSAWSRRHCRLARNSLVELASTHRVPVFRKVSAALNCVIKKLQENDY